MSAQPEHPAGPAGPVAAIPHTINGIADALTGTARARFYAEVLGAEEGEPILAVMRRWWTVAMLGQAPGAERSRVNAAAGRHLVAIGDLAGRLGVPVEGVTGIAG